MNIEAELRTSVDSQVFGSAEAGPGGQVIDLIRSLLAKAAEMIRVTPEQAAAIKEAALKIYDERIASIDIPNIGPIIEKAVDAALRRVLESALDMLLEQVTI